MDKRKTEILRAVLPILAGCIVASIPPPQGLPINAWLYFALFVAVITGVITEPIPAAAIGLIGVVIAAVSGVVYKSPSDSVKWALSGFSNTTVWLIFAAYMFCVGYIKTGLGKRIALWFVRALGKRTLGLGYAVAFSDLALAPFTPSNTARSGGTILPIIMNIPPLYGSHPGETARKIGSYIMYTALAVTCVTSSMFLTGLAPNLLAVSLVEKSASVSITWSTWFLGFLPVGIILFLLVPFLLYKIYPPEIKYAPDIPKWASEQLKAMGRITKKELTLLGLVVLALALWIRGTDYIDATTTAVLVVSLMVILRVVSWDDVIGYKQAWNVLVWFATLVTMADGLVKVKFVDWVANAIVQPFEGLNLISAIILLTGMFFFLHYLFASLTAHTTALLPVFFAVAIRIPGISATTWALLLSYTLGLMGILTPYATGPSPIYYGSGYIKGRDFWLYGLILGVIFFAVYIAIGIPWLLFLGI
ncbi:anion permease [Candidatus Bathyarchaeota archaeon]|nr:anion permease [Candidatus Bathyarchaeota archaeon]